MSSSAQLPPGPKEFKFRQALKMGLSIYDYLDQCAEEFGDAFTLNLPGMEPMVWVSRPDMVKSFFSLKPEDIDQSKLAIPIDIGDNQTGFLNNKEHAHSRKVVIPTLIAKRLHDRADVMHEIITQHIDAMKPGDEHDAPRLVGDITLDIACYTLLGLKSGDKKEQYKKLMLDWIMASTNNTMFLLGTLYGPSKFRNRLHSAYLKKTEKGNFGSSRKGILPWSHSIELKAQLADMMRKDIRDIRNNPESGRTDMLSSVALARYEDGELLPEERVISEAMGMLVGGHETSAATSAWYMLWLLKRPDVYKKMHDAVMKSVTEEGRFDPLKIAEISYLNACLAESQRLTPSAVGTMRCLIKECKIGPLTIPANTNVLAAAYLTQRRKDIWGEDALEYRPERWLEGKQPSPFEYYPFGGGRRACVGSNQAKQQMRIIFAELARRVEFSSPYATTDEWPGQQQVSGQTEPQGGVPLTVTKVRPSNYGIPAEAMQAAS
jgi:cytochrome P450